MLLLPRPLAPLLLAFLPAALAYSFSISPPTQCGNVHVSWNGGQGPYSLQIIPVGAPTITPEIRKILTFNIPAGQTSYTFQLPYPANSSFLPVFGDVNGIGTGGTGVATVVGTSNDTSCFGSPVRPEFSFFVNPPTLLQCEPVQIGFINQTMAQPPITIYAIIPGGESFQIPVPQNVASFNYTVGVRAGTSVFFLVGDANGKGTGGTSEIAVVQGLNNGGSEACLSSSSPSSTLGVPAGAVTSAPTPTLPASNPSNGGGGNKTNIGPIIGGVVGGVVGVLILGLLGLFFYRRHRHHRRNIDLLQEDDSPAAAETEGAWARPEPFLVPAARTSTPRLPSIHAGDDYSYAPVGTPDGRRPTTELFSDSGRSGSPTDYNRESMYEAGGLPPAPPGTAVGSTSTRKGGAPPQMRPVNYIQHDDGGAAEEPEVVELPPAYTSVRKPGDPATPE